MKHRQILIYSLFGFEPVASNLELFNYASAILYVYFVRRDALPFWLYLALRYVVDTLTAKRGIKVVVFGPDGRLDTIAIRTMICNGA